MKKIFLYVAIGILILAIPATVYLAGRNQEIRKRAAPASTLSLSPATITKKAGESFTLEVKIDTATNQVAVIQMQLLYDPAKLQAEDITNGPLAPSIRVSGKVDPAGRASITVGAKSNAQLITGSGTVAVLTMKALSASTVPITVRFAPHPDTYANALSESGNNVLIGTTQTTVTVLNADGTQTQADSTGAVPTVTLSATPAIPAPTLASGGSATQSAEASASALTITSLTNNESIATGTPLIQGKGVPGSTVTLVIHSDPQTVTVTVDANGNWVYTPTTPLPDGPHTVEAMTTDPSTGTTQTTTTAFVVASGSEGAGIASGSAIPASGNSQFTLILISLGVLLLVSGAMLPLFVR